MSQCSYAASRNHGAVRQDTAAFRKKSTHPAQLFGNEYSVANIYCILLLRTEIDQNSIYCRFTYHQIARIRTGRPEKGFNVRASRSTPKHPVAEAAQSDHGRVSQRPEAALDCRAVSNHARASGGDSEPSGSPYARTPSGDGSSDTRDGRGSGSDHRHGGNKGTSGNRREQAPPCFLFPTAQSIAFGSGAVR